MVSLKLLRSVGWLGAAVLLSSCGTPGAEQLRYTGAVSPQAAPGGATCGEASSGTLTTSKGHFTFTPTDGVLTLGGEVGGDGSLDATLALPGADKKPYPLRFIGRMTDAGVIGQYITPRCSFTVNLQRNRARPFEVPYL